MHIQHSKPSYNQRIIHFLGLTAAESAKQTYHPDICLAFNFFLIRRNIAIWSYENK